MTRKRPKKKISSKGKTVQNHKMQKRRGNLKCKYEINKLIFIFIDILQRKQFRKFANIRKATIF
jgi:hypothetical protein